MADHHVNLTNSRQPIVRRYLPTGAPPRRSLRAARRRATHARRGVVEGSLLQKPGEIAALQFDPVGSTVASWNRKLTSLSAIFIRTADLHRLPRRRGRRASRRAQ